MNPFTHEGLLKFCDVTEGDMLENTRNIDFHKGKTFSSIDTVVWFLPTVQHVLKGGVRTVFTFAEMLSIKHGTLNIFVFCPLGGNFNTEHFSNLLLQFFPQIKFITHVYAVGKSSIDDIPKAQIAICTLWTTAYVLLKYNKSQKKIYLMQDYEPLFYEAGSMYSIVEQTYRFGFSCIANTCGVANKYKQYSANVNYFVPGIDHDTFFPDYSAKPTNHYRLIFYGRPSNPRNCFLLCAKVVQKLKSILKHRIEIISVGAEWDPAEYKLAGIVRNLGLLSDMNEIAKLYRSAHLGLVFMSTPHPSYQPFEYMASGCVVVTNQNEANQWLINNDNALIVEPLYFVAAEKICKLLSDNERFMKLAHNGLATAQLYTWHNAFNSFAGHLFSA